MYKKSFRLIIISVLFIVYSCISYKELVVNGITITGSCSRSFTINQIDSLIKYKDYHNELKNMVLGEIVVNKNLHLGLYKFRMYNTNLSKNIYHKVLKFENKIVFPENDTTINKKNIEEFINKYKNEFKYEDILKIKESFLIGSEFEGRFF